MKASVKLFEPSRSPLAGIPKLECRVAVYVPTTIGDLPASPQVIAYQREKVAESLSRKFGGFTEVQANGGWFSETKGKLIRETVYVIYAFAEKAAVASALPELVEEAARIAVAMEQDSVGLEIDGKFHLVSASHVSH